MDDNTTASRSAQRIDCLANVLSRKNESIGEYVVKSDIIPCKMFENNNVMDPL